MEMKGISVSPKIEESWFAVLSSEFEQDYFLSLKTRLVEEKRAGATVYPPGPEIFKAYNTTPFNKVKVVVLGQDPYHGAGQAHGLCFSVADGVKPPPSLKNIYKEIESDLGFAVPNGGNLSSWSEQGVFLLNAFLTVRKSEPASHRKFGWQHFTDASIKALSDYREGLVFMLWGNFAQQKADLIDGNRHLILKAPHPSPFSAHSGFFGSKHFSKANKYLTDQGLEPINWKIDG